MLTRFAPSPTGLMHFGNVRTALICYLYAKKHSGKFMLRIDDTDTNVSTEEYKNYIKRDLQWLGLNWDVYAEQSKHFKRYNDVFNKLIAAGRVYKCYETAEELEIKRKMLISRGLPPIYDRASLNEENIEKYEKEGCQCYFRFKINTEDTITWEDEIKGNIAFAGANLSDPVIMRTNGMYTYMLPSVIDDVDYKVTNVVRGEDHISNTAIQIQMFEALVAPVPKFAHLSLLKTGGNKLSKRLGALDVNSLRLDEIEPMAINSYLATVGSSCTVKPYNNLDELVTDFDINRFSSSPVLLNIKEIDNLNEKIIRDMQFAEVCKKVNIDGLTEEFWEVVRYNIKTLTELSDWWRICKTEFQPVIDDPEFLRVAYNNLPEGEWNEKTWEEWVARIKIATQRKGKELFMPLRLALTGAEEGPELAKILPLISKELIAKRFQHDN